MSDEYSHDDVDARRDFAKWQMSAHLELVMTLCEKEKKIIAGAMKAVELMNNFHQEIRIDGADVRKKDVERLIVNVTDLLTNAYHNSPHEPGKR